MPKLMLFQAEARAALAQGVEKLTKTVQGTLGPKGGNTIIDRPVGTPIVSRDGVSIIQEIELEDLFENMGAQVAREVSMQTNEEAGDGTTTALILANAMIQEGFAVVKDKVNPVDVVDGIEQAVEFVIDSLTDMAQPLDGDAEIEAVAKLSANDAKIGRLVAKAVSLVGLEGIIQVEEGQLGETTLELDEGASFERGYLSHHMVTDVERMDAVLENPLILISDLKIHSAEQLVSLQTQAAGRPLLVIAEEVAADAIAGFLSNKEAGSAPLVAVHPPDYGKWRQAILEDIAILTGGQVLTKDLGTRVEDATAAHLGSAEQIRVTSDNTIVKGGSGDAAHIRGRREHVRRQLEITEVMVDYDKLELRLAKLSGGVAVIRAGGTTPAERMRREQLIEDSVNATRSAVEEGVVPGGGTALAQISSQLDGLVSQLSGGTQDGAKAVQQALVAPLRCIAENCGIDDTDALVQRVATSAPGVGFNGWTGELTDLKDAGIMDSVRSTSSGLRNASSIACLILTTQSLVTDKPEWDDPTYGAARGGGAELLEMSNGVGTMM